MASAASAVNTSEQTTDPDITEVPENFEPGACKEKMLVTTDSCYRDLVDEVEETKEKDQVDDDLESAVEDLTMTEEDLRSQAEEEERLLLEEGFDIHSPEWKEQKKHIFILSEAGKPIYSRYGNEDKLATLMGVMQALVSFVLDGKDSIKSITAGKHKFVFLVRSPVILVAVSRGSESANQLVMQLTYLHNQIVSLLTQSQLTRIFEQRRNYDLRRLLAGSEKFLDSLTIMMDTELGVLLGAVRCLPIASSTRDQVTQAIVHGCQKIKDLVFAILVANNQLVTLVRLKKHIIHPADIHLIFNLISASESFKSAESWMPLCLPKFDSSGFLHAHVSYLEEGNPCCLLLLSVNKDKFFELADAKTKIVERLRKYNCLEELTFCANQRGYSVGQVEIPDLRHFMYKSHSTSQYTSPSCADPPYVEATERERMVDLYLNLHHRVHSSARPLKICYVVCEKETLLGWVTTGFELYIVFEPLVQKGAAINAINKLLRWIKKEEERLFILNSATF